MIHSYLRPCVWLLVLAFALPAIAQDPAFDKFFEDFAKKREGIRTLQAEYTEKSITPDETFISEGKLLYSQPRRILRHTFYPYDTTVLIEGQKAIEFEPDVKQAVISDLSQAKEADILFFGFDNDTKKLRENYDVKIFSIADNPLGKNGLEIKPKAGDEDAVFQSVTLYLADDTLLPYRVHVVFDPDSELQVDIGTYTVNGEVSAEQSRIKLPEGTKIIENEKVLETTGPEGKWLPDAPPAGDAATLSKPAPDTEGLLQSKPLDAPPPK